MPESATPALAIAATFTAEPLQEFLDFWLSELRLDLTPRFALYNQVFQTLLDPSGIFASNPAGVNVVLARPEDWSRHAGEPFSRETLEQNVRQFIASVQSAAPSLNAPLLIFLCPASPEFLAAPDRRDQAAAVEERFASELAPLASVYVFRSSETLDLYPVARYDDPAGDELGHIPYTPEFFSALATRLMRAVHALRTPPYKVLVLDCDNTLWRGICGEDGPEGVEMDPGRKALQDVALRQRDSGMLLAVCSKNNEEDVLETFRLHPEMRLALTDFTARRINWEPKSSNLHALAADLDLGLDSLIFIDDDPKECAEVEANCPGVLALPLPAEDEIEHFLRHVWAFDRLKVTREDRERSAQYAQRTERRRFEQQAATLDEFLAGLHLEVRIAPVEPAQLARASQLTLRTNQMNATLIRRSESELQSLLLSGEIDCLAVDASDRFGAYGLIGLMIFGATADTLRGDTLCVDTFLMSCRAFGRGIEHRMLRELGRIAAARGCSRVQADFMRGPRNRPAHQFLESAQPVEASPILDGIRYIFSAAQLSDLQYRPSANDSPQFAEEPRSETSSDARVPVPYARIATELAHPEQVLAAVQSRRAAGSPVARISAEPVTAIEQRLAAIWAELLGLATVGRDQNFFDLGGHSLLAVQLLSRMRDEFGVDLSLEIVYSGDLTVAELARTIELYEIGQSDMGEYAAILAEIESLSDEEARAILAEEEAGGGAGRGSRCESS